MGSPRDSLEAARPDQLKHLISRIAGGDQSAVTTLYDETSRLVFGLVVRILNDHASAEEVLLDVYTQVWRQAGKYDETRGAPLAWLATIARTRAIDRLRSKRSEIKSGESLETAGSVSSGYASPEEAAAVSERGQLVRQALESLSPEQREVIELAYYSGLSHSEIAIRLGQPLGTVKTRTRLGMMKLRDSLRPLLEGHP